MSDETPTLEKSLQHLRSLNHFRLVLDDLAEDREDAIVAAGMAEDTFSSAKAAGRIEAVDMILRKLRGE